jgi:hypothetical protein
MRGAVAKSYKASRATARVAAVDAGEYALRRVRGGSVVDGGGVVLGTADDHDPRGRSGTGDEGGCGIVRVEDDDDDVPIVVLQGDGGQGNVLRKGGIHRTVGSQMRAGIGLQFRPVVRRCGFRRSQRRRSTRGRQAPSGLIAQLSPRAFWSLLYHCSDGPTHDRRPSTARPSVEDMLRSTQPQLDWPHLDQGGRMRALSEKARENSKQQQAVGGAAGASSCSSADDDAEARVKAVEDLAESA